MLNLIVVISLLFIMALLMTIEGYILHKYRQEALENEASREKAFDYYQILVAWVKTYQRSKTLSTWLKNRKIEKVAIYGIKEMGQLLYRDLIENDIDVVYWIDQKPDSSLCKEKIYAIDDSFPDSDLIIITASYYFSEIEKNLKSKGIQNIVSIADIVFDCLDT